MVYARLVNWCSHILLKGELLRNIYWQKWEIMNNLQYRHLIPAPVDRTSASAS